MRRNALLAVCAMAFAQAVAAAPADDVKALIDKGDARGAYQLGKKYPGELGNPAFDFFFGVAAIDSGNAGEGVLALERYVANYPDNLQGRLELARGYFVLGEDARARQEFNDALRMAPPPSVTATVERYLDALRARESAYRTTVGAFVELGVGYDSNINGGVSNATISLPGTGVFTVPQPGVKTEAWFAQATAGASIVHPVAPGIALFGSFTGDYRMHDHADGFDQASVGISAGASYLRDKDLFRGTLAWSTLELDHDRFRDTLSLTGEWVRQLDELQSIMSYVQYADLSYAPANEARDSRLIGLGLGYRRAFIGAWQPLMTVSGSYAKEDNLKSRDDFARDIWGLRAVVSLTPAPKWAVGAGATFYYSDYDQPDPALSPDRRLDKYYAADLTASYALTRNLSVRGEFLISKNQSNLALYDYDRAVAALKIRYEFK